MFWKCVPVVFISIWLVSCSGGPWVARIDGNHPITLSDFRDEFKSFARISGLTKSDIERFYDNEDEKREFLAKMVDKEMIYLAAIKEKIDTNASVKKTLLEQTENQIVQFYAYSLIGTNANVTEAETMAAFRELSPRLAMMNGGRPVAYQSVQREITGMVAQKKLTEKYKEVVDAAKKEFNVVIDAAKDPMIVAAGVTNISKAEVDEKVKKLEEAGVVPAERRGEVRTLTIENIAGVTALRLKAKKTGYWNGAEAKTAARLARKQVLIEEYISRRMKNVPAEPTEAELDQINAVYGKQYGLDQMPYGEQRKRLIMMAKQIRVGQQQKAIVDALKESRRIEKKVEAIKQ
ncbi:MAG: hypothetical protein AABZ39_06755 [Spirochaetota bacterium]